jgi:hypothetical protein
LKPRKLNAGSYHLSCIISGEDTGNIDDIFSDAQLFRVKMVDEYFTYIVNILSTRMAPSYMRIAHKKTLVVKSIDYQLIVGKLYKLGVYGILRRCVLEHESPMILS